MLKRLVANSAWTWMLSNSAGLGCVSFGIDNYRNIKGHYCPSIYLRAARVLVRRCGPLLRVLVSPFNFILLWMERKRSASRPRRRGRTDRRSNTNRHSHKHTSYIYVWAQRVAYYTADHVVFRLLGTVEHARSRGRKTDRRYCVYSRNSCVLKLHGAADCCYSRFIAARISSHLRNTS